MDGFPHRVLQPGDFDWKKEVEAVVREVIKQERPELLEAKES
jgi:hypothetical protein